MEKRMKGSLSFQDFADVVNYIGENNGPIEFRGDSRPRIKYIDPVFDMRTNEVFYIKFRTYSNEVDFYSNNEWIDGHSMKDRIMVYLKSGHVIQLGEEL